VQPVGSAFGAAVALSCSGLPSGAQCLFVPAGAITPGNSAVDVVMSISTSSGSNVRGPNLRSPNARRKLWLSNRDSSSPSRGRLRVALFAGANLLWPGMLLAWIGGRRGIGLRGRRRKKFSPFVGARRFAVASKLVRAAWLPLLLALLLLLPVFLLSCGGVSNGGGGGGNCSSTPAAPTGLIATWSNSGTVLNWTAPDVGPNCSLAYPVYQNGASTPIATVPTATYGAPSLGAAPLPPPGAYTFTVAANDAAGTSAPSAPVGIYTVTVTGTAPGTAADAGQSTQVILVVN
jgi:hypothetical protein